MDMGKVRHAALAHYQGMAEKDKNMAERLFKGIDMDQSGNISIDEFIAVLDLLGLQSDDHYRLFAQLDKDSNGTLDFQELVTFFYILNHDEYKKLLNSQPKAHVSRWKERFRRWKQKANNQGRRRNWKETINLLGGLAQISQFLIQICGGSSL